MPSSVLINGRYELKNALGHGGMGIVYRAYDISTRRDVAVKTMNDTANPLAVELFAKEWKVLANICHPNIIDILDCGEFESKGHVRPYFVMPLLPGNTLDQLIHGSSERLTIARVIEILRQTCRGLQAAHEHGLVHRDLKPSNIFVMQDDTAKIIDFGVVHLTGSQTVTGLKGTVQYMAPEQLEMKPATPQSDIFSLGVVGYEAITGRKPFARKTEAETLDAVRLHIPPPASEINPSAGDQVSRVIHKAMAKQPWNRFASAREFGDLLDKALRGEAVFDTSKIRRRIERAAKSLSEGDVQFASDILNELEAEGNIDPEMSVLRMQVERAGQQRMVRQLLESARTRLEQEEYPLALQKVQEVLKVDPGNLEAIGIRDEINAQNHHRQVENWIRLAREHLERGAFSDARQGLQEALKFNPNDSRAQALLNDLKRQEQENSKARLQKEHLYEEAREAFESGEISTALSKLERVLDLNRRVPDRTSPERDALYQTFYNKVRSESDAMRIAYEEARSRLAEKDFAAALKVCQENLEKHPGQALFHALKLEIGERERQELYGYIADIERRIDAEPDLDRKVNIAKEAVERYPNEAQFKQSLKLVRDRRDLVASIVAKTRLYEERGQFAEAMGQWEILRGIYPQYPGLQFEVEQLKRRRDLQVREEAKARWVEQTDAALTTGDFARAKELAAEALAEFPGDPEFTALARLADERIDHRRQVGELLSEGRRLCGSKHFDQGLVVLREAAALDSQDPDVRAALTDALVHHAQGLMNGNWEDAEPHIQSALELDPENPAAKSIRAQIQDHRRRQTVDACLAEARDLRIRGDYPGALEKVEVALKKYPNDARLVQFQAAARKDAAESEARQQRSRDLIEVRRLSERAEAVSERGALEPLLARTLAISRKYPDDDEFLPLTRVLDARALRLDESRKNGPPVDSAQFPSRERSTDLTWPDPVNKAAADAQAPVAQAPKAPLKIAEAAAEPKLPSAPSGRLRTPPDKPPAGPPNVRPTPLLKWGGIAAALLLVAVVASMLNHSRRTPAPAPMHVQDIPVYLDLNPPNATVQIDGSAAGASVRLAPGGHKFQVSSAGYKTLSRTVAVHSGMSQLSFGLDPEPQRLEIVTNFPRAKVWIDGKATGDLDDGRFVKDDLSLSEHTVQLMDGNHELVRVRLVAKAAQPAQLLSPVDKNVVVLSTFSSAGKLYTGTLKLQSGSSGSALPIPAGGLNIPGGTGPELTLTDGKRTQTYPLETSNYPLLAIFANLDDDQQGRLAISTNIDDPQISVNGKPVQWRLFRRKIRGRLDPGTYILRLSKPGYQDSEQSVALKKGEERSLTFVLKPIRPVASLLIRGGVPGTELLIDDVPKGQLDDGGALTVDQIPAGAHEVTLKKQNYEPRSFSRDFAAEQGLQLSAPDAALTPFGAIEFHLLTPNSEIAYRRKDEAQMHSVSNGETVRVQQGGYVVSASADGFETREHAVEVSAGKVFVLTWALDKIPAKTVQATTHDPLALVSDRANWQLSNGWIEYQGPAYGWMRSARGSFSVDLRRRPGNIFGGGAIGFVLGYSQGGRNKVAYHIGRDRLLVQRVTVEGKTAETKSAVQLPEGEHYRLVIVIEPSRAIVRDYKGNLLAECSSPGFDLAAGKFGFRGGFLMSIARQE